MMLLRRFLSDSLSSSLFAFTIPATALLAAGLLVLGQPAWSATGTAAAQTTVIYVDTDNSSGTKDGDSWATAYTSLHDALADADATGSSAANTQIWIADGLYTPADDPDISTTKRDTSFIVTGKQDGLEIYGGFTGKGEDEETSLSERDVDGNPPVVLSGDIDDNDTVNGQGVTENYSDITCCNSYRVLLFDGGEAFFVGNDIGPKITGATVLDGVTVTGGQASASGVIGSGAGLFCDGVGTNGGGGCSPTIKNAVFQGNFVPDDADGGAIYLGGNDNIDGSTVEGESSPTVTNVVFEGNKAGSGGAIYSNATDGKSSPTITDSRFVNNIANDGTGGAIHSIGAEGRFSPTITDVLFKDNRSSGGGGAMWVGSRESTLECCEDNEQNRPRIKRSVFIGNSAHVGNGDAGATISFSGEGDLGGVVTNSVFANSGAYHVYFFGDDARSGSSPRFVNCTFTGADEGVLAVFQFFRNEPIAFVNSIFSGSGGDMAAKAADAEGKDFDPDAAMSVRYSLVEEASYAEGAANGGTGNIDGTDSANAPQFADASDPAGSDGDFGTLDDGLRLQGPGSGNGASPAIDAGDNSALPSNVSADLVEQSRRQDVSGVSDTGNGSAPIVDMGAYESDGSALPVEMAGFDATLEDESVRLAWQTASETGNAGFRIQRKGERERGGERAWTTVGSVDGAGTTSEVQRYRFTDAHLPYEADALTYRLKQVDTDGSTSFSETVTVERGVTEVQLLGTYPNPARQQATVRYALPEKQETTIRLYDVLGRQVRTVVSGKKEGRHEQTLEVGDLSSGVYVLRLRTGGTIKTQKLTIVR